MAEAETLLAMVDRHIAQAEEHVARQRRLIARLEMHDLPTSEAEALLAKFETALCDHLEHRGGIVDEQASGRRDGEGKLVFGRSPARPG